MSLSMRSEVGLPYQVNADVMAATGNPAVKFMHCLPALHNRDSQGGRELYERCGLAELEVTDDVFASPGSVVFDQAGKRGAHHQGGHGRDYPAGAMRDRRGVR